MVNGRWGGCLCYGEDRINARDRIAPFFAHDFSPYQPYKGGLVMQFFTFISEWCSGAYFLMVLGGRVFYAVVFAADFF